ncbi:restriction endonuclease [Rhodococcus sp. HNM0563]|nr:NaeI family type II restriction endonuclease [Rhodococcus sp. HNM0563]NLU61371.1 restriction endonuclease [Rhodococcus sp. HNM0563]
MDALTDVAPPHGEDPGLDAVEAELLRLDPTGDRVASVLRDTLDQLYDGQHTGRWSFDQLHKTEKTHMGTLVEINLHREFGFEDGDATDYRIAGIEVDCKYSMRSGGWTLPPEVIGHVALLITADDSKAAWRAGIVRVETEHLNVGRNRDQKGTLSAAGRNRIRWLWPAHGRLAPNLFLNLDAGTRDRIFSARAPWGSHHGQARTNELFRSVQGQIIRRAEVATVAQQDDSMKRARGARDKLRAEGILVLGHQDNDPLVARALGLPVPRKGELVSARVVRAQPGSSAAVATVEGIGWTLAHADDPVVPAPVLPRGKGSEQA